MDNKKSIIPKINLSDDISEDYVPSRSKNKTFRNKVDKNISYDSKQQNNSLVKVNKKYNVITINMNPIYKPKNKYCKIKGNNQIIISKRALIYHDSKIILDGNCLNLKIFINSLNLLSLKEDNENELENDDSKKYSLRSQKVTNSNTKNGKVNHRKTRNLNDNVDINSSFISEIINNTNSIHKNGKNKTVKSHSISINDKSYKSSEIKSSYKDVEKLTDSNKKVSNSKLKKKRKKHGW